MRFRRLKVQLQTTDGPYGVTLDFPDGLVVIWADNSMGKSTCVKSILIALGMEAMLTTNQSDLPLPPAVKSRLESSNGEYAILESEVFLELENSQGERIVLQRTIKGKRDKNLITVYLGPALTSPGLATGSSDFFVNRQGAASREHGFHHFLARFLGWSLPLVQTYDGNEYPLYLQCILPYFIVEQTRGWSTVQPPLPTHFRIREAHKRAIEFLLHMDAHQIALKRQEITFELKQIENEWSSQVVRGVDLAGRVGGTLHALPEKPIASWPPQVQPSLLVPKENGWITISNRIEEQQLRLNELVQGEMPRVQEVAASAQDELNSAESLVREKQLLLSRLLDTLSMEEQEVKRVEERLVAIDEDIQKNKDVRTLRKLGSRQNSAIEHGSCPVCHQAVPDSLIPLDNNQNVMTLDENIKFLAEQRRTYEAVLENARRVVGARTLQVRALRDELAALRENVRVLKQTLVSDGRLPSQAAIHARIELEHSIKSDLEADSHFEKILQEFLLLSERWSNAHASLLSLPKSDLTLSDEAKLTKWTHSLRKQLVQYGFRSFHADQVGISLDTYLPEHEGFDMQASFSLQTSISASDLIRTIWSYLNGLLELSREIDTNHPGCIIFDEPRQQSTRDVSFTELLKRASAAGKYGQQVIFFTSESIERLESHLDGLPHSLNKIDGRVLQKLD